MTFRVDQRTLFLQVNLVLQGVATREFKQLQLVAPLWHGHLHVVEDKVQFHRDDDFCGMVAQLLSQVGDSQQQKLFCCLFQTAFHLEGMALHHSAVLHLHIVHIEGLVLVDVREHLHVVNRLADHRRTAAVVLQKVVFLLDELCLLKLHARGMVHHHRLQVTQNAAQVALDDFSDLGNHGVVVGLRNQALARAVAFVDVVVEAHLVFTFFDTCFRQWCAAGAHLIDLAKQVQEDMRRAHRGIGAEVL